jgi:glycosyltransferase involved in cell wall biosynthesis
MPCPRASIILPVRNAASTLPATLDSLWSQSETSWELIAVDDGSTDATPALLYNAALIDPRIRVMSTGPLGLVHALQTACSLVRGPLIARMDADDTTHPERLSIQCHFLDSHPDIGLVSCQVKFGGDPDTAGGYLRHIQWINSLVSHELIYHQRFVESPFAHPSVVFRTSLLQSLGGYRNGLFPEDYELWLRWLNAGVIMSKVPESLLVWNDPPERLSRTDHRYAPDAFYRLKASYLALALRSHTGRPVWIWGSGRVTRHRAAFLFQHGIQPQAWIDIDTKKIGQHIDGLTVHAPEDIPESARPFILTYVASWGAREFALSWFQNRGWRAGEDYLLCA